MGATTSSEHHNDTTSTNIMTSLPKSVPRKPHSPYSFTTNARAGPGPSTIARGASAKANVIPDTKDKEEGEISDGEEEEGEVEGPPRPPTPPRRGPPSPARRRSGTYHPIDDNHPFRRAGSSSRQSQSRSPHARSLPPRPPNVATPPLKQSLPLPPTPEVSVKVKTEKRHKKSHRKAEAKRQQKAEAEIKDRPDHSMADSSGPPAMSAEEAEEFTKELRTMAVELGVTREELLRRGAPAQYVNAAFDQLAESARQALADVATPPIIEAPLPPVPSPPTKAGSTPTMERKPSIGSEASEERLVDLLMGPASPKHGSSKMVKSSSWHPSVSPPALPPPPLDAYPPTPPPPPLRIDSYRPPTPPGRPPVEASSASLSSSGTQSSTTLTATMQNFHPMSSYRGSASPLPPSHQNPYLPPPPVVQPNPYSSLPPVPQQNPYLSPGRPPNPYLSLPPTLPPNPNPYPSAPTSRPPNPYLPPPPVPQYPYLPAQSVPPSLPVPPNPYLTARAPPPDPQNSYHPPPPLPPHRASLPPKPTASTTFYAGLSQGSFPDMQKQHLAPNGYPMNPVAPFAYSDQPPPPEPTPPARDLEAELAARTALLETRRKAFESMKRRREANRPVVVESAPAALVSTPPIIDLTEDDDDISIIMDDEDEDGEVVPEGTTIEEQMAQLEQEVMGLQTEQAAEVAAAAAAAMADDIDMDMESAEDGEIEDDIPPPSPKSATTTPVLSIPTLPPPTTTPAVKIPRGTKRANAEDMMDNNRPTTAPARLPPNKRRSLFGGMPQRPNRLVMLLDHSDSDSDDEDEDDVDKSDRMAKLKITSGNSTPISDTARLLAEKEEGIRKLREQIEKRMKARVIKKAPGESKGKAKVEQAKEVVVEKVEVVVKEEPMESEKLEPVEQASEDVVMTDNNVVSAEPETFSEASKETAASVGVIQEGPKIADAAAVAETDELPPIETLEVIRSSPTLIETETPSAPQPTPTSHFRLYSYLLPRYPLLQIGTGLQPSSGQPGHSSGDIDQNLLSSIVLTRRLQKEPEAKLCAAETAGGSCADASCGDIHLVKGVLSDDDLAEYLSHTFPGRSTEDIIAKLREARIALRPGSNSTSALSTTPKRKGRVGKTIGGVALSRDPSRDSAVDIKELLAHVGRQLASE